MNNTSIVENPLDQFLDCQFERINETYLKVTLPIQPLLIKEILRGNTILSKLFLFD